MTVKKVLEATIQRYSELEDAKEAIENLLCDMECIPLPDGIQGSHHADMEWSDTLSTIESEMCEIENRIY